MTVTDEGSYSVVVTRSGGGSVTAGPATLTVVAPPVITSQPESHTANVAATTIFTVAATGRQPFAFQWKKDGVALSNGSHFSGCTTDTLSIANVTALDEGNYSVTIFNSDGSVGSFPATLIVVLPPVITTQPASQTKAPGSNVTFIVEADGTEPFDYQWRFNGSDITGATNSEFTLANIQVTHAGDYSVLVSNPAGSQLSSNATLTIKADFTLPTVRIDFPTAGQRLVDGVNVTNYQTRIRGTATDDKGIAQVLFSLNNSPWLDATGTQNWTADVNLVPGLNTLSVKSIDTSSNESLVVVRSFTFVVTSPLRVNILGTGQVSSNWSNPNLEIAKIYRMTAVAGSNYVFTNWTRVIAGATNFFSNTNILDFVMQSNLVLNANFIANPFTPVAGIYNGLFYETNGVTHQSAGFFTLKTTSKLTFSGKLLLDGNVVSASGKFLLPGTATKTVSRAKFGRSDLTLSLALDFANGSDQITGTVQNGTNWTSVLLGDRWIWTTNAGQQAIQFTNAYTFLVPGFNSSAAGPVGAGCGFVTVNLLGKLALKGSLADSRTLSQSTMISRNGQWPLYVGLYPEKRIFTNSSGAFVTNVISKGSLLGWVTFTTNTPATKTNLAPQGTLSWIKTGWTNTLYPEGFTNSVSILGSRHIPPASGKRVLNLTNGVVVMSEGDLSGPFTNALILNTNNSVTLIPPVTNTLIVRVIAKTGAWQGTFAHPNIPFPATRYFGVLLQDYNFGRGWFVGGLEGGAATLDKQ